MSLMEIISFHDLQHLINDLTKEQYEEYVEKMREADANAGITFINIDFHKHFVPLTEEEIRKYQIQTRFDL